MKIKMMNKVLVMFTGLFVLASLAGCSTQSGFANKKDISVERVSSKSAKIMRAGLYPVAKNNMVLRGELKRRVYLRGKIPGYLRVELVDANGETFKEADFGYRLKDTKSRLSLFAIPIPFEPASISAVRVTHHDMISQIESSTQSMWRDATGK